MHTNEDEDWLASADEGDVGGLEDIIEVFKLSRYSHFSPSFFFIIVVALEA